MRSRALMIGLALFVGALAPWSGASAVPAEATRPAEPHDLLKSIRTVLLTGEATTWLDAAEPPYDVGVTLKMKLQRVGFRVVFDPNEPHDAEVVVRYRETPGREYQRLEHGTNITCDLGFQHATLGTLRAYHMEAATPWPLPGGSLYWEAVRGLEENPYYYYFGELLHGWVMAQDDSSVVFSRMLRQPPLVDAAESGDGSQATGHVVANRGARLHAIQELGRLKDPRAVETLWMLVDGVHLHERMAAVEAIGALQDRASLDRLSRMQHDTQDAELHRALTNAILLIQQGR